MMIGKVVETVRFCALVCLMLLPSGYTRALPDYPNAQIQLTVDENRTDYPIITSRMKRVNGVVISDDARRLDGHLNRKLYLLSQGHSATAGFEFYLNQLQKKGVTTLFECQNFACGASNFWANEVFGISRLYGQDKTQAFYIGKQNGRYYCVYAVRRGNGRIYTLVDVFTPTASNPSRDNVLSTRSVNHSELDPWVTRLKQEPTLAALVIIQSTIPNTVARLDALQQQMSNTQRALLNYLKGQGIDANRVRFNQSLTTDAGELRDKPEIWLEIVPIAQ